MAELDTRQAIAEAVGRAMYAKDHVAQALDIRLDAIGPGHARMRMTVRRDMLNGHATLHGGMSFTLADTAFAYACNSHNEITVAAGCSIVYPAAGREGDVLTAEAVETHRAGRSGIYDVTVTTQDGTVLALFRGQSRTVGGAVAADAPATAD